MRGRGWLRCLGVVVGERDEARRREMRVGCVAESGRDGGDELVERKVLGERNGEGRRSRTPPFMHSDDEYSA